MPTDHPRPRPSDWKHARTDVAGKRILVTGGSKGIGRATVRLLVSQGAKVLTDGRKEEDLRALADDCKGLPGELHTVAIDHTDASGIPRLFEAVDRELGGLDVLVNNAALGGGSLTDTDLDEIHRIVHVNLLAYLACCKLAIERMESQGRGHIVNIGSMSADVRETGSDVYVATKGAIQAFSESLRKLVNEKMGVKVTLVEPGQVGTDMQPTTPEEQRQEEEEGKTLTAEDIAECVWYCLVQPARCDVVKVQIRPHLQAI